jgi:Fe(II)/alpha-ketoglutarate-dependent arginine beta-hydroxylase
VLTLDISASAPRLLRALRGVVARFATAEDDDFLDRLPVLRSVLPEHVVLGLTGAMAGERAHVVVVRGFPLGDAVGPTPAHWQDSNPRTTLLPDSYLMLLGSLLGEPFGWNTLQKGRLLNDILPIAGAEQAQTGHSSDTSLAFHCEDAFHECRCDYLGLLCLRNPDNVATTVAGLDAAELDDGDREVLSQPRFVIWPDDEHQKTAAAQEAGDRPRVPVLSGDRDAPYLRIDPPYMSSLPGDERAAAALRRLTALLEARLVDVVLRPGDVCFIDNYRAVHGRRPFQARYNGTDRWLRKVIVSKDLRKSRARRASPRSRVVL